MRNPATCHFFCVQIAIDRLSPKSIHYLSRGESSELGLKAKGKRTSAPPLVTALDAAQRAKLAIAQCIIATKRTIPIAKPAANSKTVINRI
jgi:hypothetical protein